MIEFSVLIPAFNEERLLPRTLASVHASFATLPGTSYELIVCDNNSTDGTSRVAQAYGARVVFEPHNQIAKARNTAAERAQGEWLIFLDADTSLHPELLAQTVKAIRAGGLCGGGSILDFDRGSLGWFPRFLTRLWNRLSAILNLAAGSYLFCLRPAWEGAGGFDETLYAGEEIYFSMSVKKWGRPRGLRFRVLTGSPIITSARKMDWYGPWELLRHMVLLLLPGAKRRRNACGLWYDRPAGE